MRGAPLLQVVAAALALAPRSATAADPTGDLAALFARATEEEQTRGAGAGVDGALGLLDRALSGGDARQRDAAVLAALDLLVGRVVPVLDTVGGPGALAFRHPGAFSRVRTRLERAYEQSASVSPFARAAVARAAYELAMYAGDAAGAESWRGRTGCVRAATVVGPLAWPPIVATARPTPLERPGARLAASYPGVTPFDRAVAPAIVPSTGCGIELYVQNANDGLRAVVVDVNLTRPQRLAFELETRSTAVLVAGGKEVLVRGYHLGGQRVRSRGVAEVGPGRVRVVVRVGLNGEGSQLTLAVLGEDGAPLPTSAPRPGDAAPAAARAASAVPLLADGDLPRNPAERALLAAALLALGDARTAEHHLEQDTPAGADKAVAPAGPLAALLYSRALPQAGDVPENRLLPLLRAAYGATARGWPGAWEALLGQALLAVRQHGPVEGQVRALAEIGGGRKRLRAIDPAVPALQAALASRSEMQDRADAALAELSRIAAATPLQAQADRVVGERVGQELETFVCNTPALSRASNDCLNLRVSRGERAGALAEIERLRKLWAAPATYLRSELLQRYALGETAAAAALYDRMLPAQRPVAMLPGLFGGDPAGLRTRLARDLPSTSDDPAGAMALLATLLEKSPAPAWEAESARRVAEDRKAAAATEGAATLVLAHRESYAIDRDGLLRYTVYNLRRVSGTADVRSIAEVGPQDVLGREQRRTLRQRIFKPDGRVLDPEPRVGQQRRTDLSQLEPGDYLEEITQGFSVPSSRGVMGIFSQNLLAARTSVQEATVEISRPASLPLSVWAHPRLGRPKISRRGGDTVSTYSLRAAAPRRLETMVPFPDQPVAVYAVTSQWKDSGPLLAETIAALDDKDPLVSRWAAALVKDLPAAEPQARIQAVVAAVGRTIKRGNPALLTDRYWAPARAQFNTARTMLELQDGSRTWLAYRALRELGIAADLVVAEETPFSADPRYPPQFGRFRHPLIRVAGPGDRDLWLDLDVRGPPLPAGEVSPQLRGRFAVDTSGRIFTLPAAATDDHPTEVSIDLKLDDKGTARGTFSLALRGRDAQLMADELPYRVGLQRDQRLRAVVLGWLPSATVNDVSLDWEEGAPLVSLKAGVELPGYAQTDAGGLTLPGIDPLHNIYSEPPVTTLGATYAKHRGRDSSLAIDEAVQYRLRRRIELPAPARLPARPPALALRAPGIEAVRKVGMESGAPVLDERFELAIPTAALDKAGYQRFVQSVARVDDAFLTPTRVVFAR
jgi:hypothetical protein